MAPEPWWKLPLGVLLAMFGLLMAAALLLISLPAPSFQHPAPAALPDSNQDASVDFETLHFVLSDGAQLFARRFPAPTQRTTLLLHGVGGDGSSFPRSAERMRKALDSEVIVLDLRGHGRSEGTPGDVPEVGRYEQDVAEVLDQLSRQQPGRQLLLAGHSMGGGIVQRFAQLDDGPTVEGYVLFAPLLGPGAPTHRRSPSATSGAEDQEGGASDPLGGGLERGVDDSEVVQEPYLKVHQPRLLGLDLLDGMGITAWHHLPTLVLNRPEEARVRSYSFRALVSMAPADYRQGLAAFKAPMLLLVGSEDEAFRAAGYAEALGEHGTGRVFVVEGETHDGIHRATAAMETLHRWATESLGSARSASR